MEENITILPDHTYGPFVADFMNREGQHRAFIGICIYRPMSNRSFLTDLIPWVLDRTPHLTILVGDYLERHNAVTFEGLPIEKAAARVRKRGRKIRRTIERVIADIQPVANIILTDFETEMQKPAFSEIQEAVNRYHAQSSLFSADVSQEVQRFLRDSKRYPQEAKRHAAIEKPDDLNQYVLEEVAMYIHMYLSGHPIEVYPGQDLSVLRKIAERTYPEFPYDYSQRTHVGVKRKPKS